MSEGDGAQGGARRGLLGPLAFAIAVLAPGVLVLFGTLGLSAGGGYSPVRPGFFPLIVAGRLLFFGVTLLVRTTAKPDAYLREKAVAESEATYWSTIGLLLAVLAAYAFLLDPLGYVFATALFFPTATYVLGDTQARSLIRNLVIGLAVGAFVFFGCTEILRVSLPEGLLDPFL